MDARNTFSHLVPPNYALNTRADGTRFILPKQAEGKLQVFEVAPSRAAQPGHAAPRTFIAVPGRDVFVSPSRVDFQVDPSQFEHVHQHLGDQLIGTTNTALGHGNQLPKFVYDAEKQKTERYRAPAPIMKRSVSQELFGPPPTPSRTLNLTLRRSMSRSLSSSTVPSPPPSVDGDTERSYSRSLSACSLPAMPESNETEKA